MEYHQQVQNRALQTAAVINANAAGLTVSGLGAAALVSQANALDTLAGARDLAIAAADAAANQESAGYTLLRRLDLGLPQVASGELDDSIPAEADMAGLLDAAYAIVPDTTEAAVKRGMKLKAALEKINPFLGAMVPPRGPITSGGLGLADLTAALTAQQGLEQTVETRAAEATKARGSLKLAARALDRLNKRFYQKLLAEARTNPALADALAQITTDDANLPGTLGIRKVLQGGTGGLQLLVSYDNASYDDSLENTLEWMVTGVDAEFTHSVAVDPSGNALGPFTASQEVKLRTRTRNSNGTTTSSVRTLTITTPV
jgi:hypothetical protein